MRDINFVKDIIRGIEAPLYVRHTCITYLYTRHVLKHIKYKYLNALASVGSTECRYVSTLQTTLLNMPCSSSSSPLSYCVVK